MSSFERRLDVMERRTVAPGRSPSSAPIAADLTMESATAVGWHAAERVSLLSGVEPGTTIKLVVESPRDGAVVEVTWDADGQPSIRTI